MKNEFNKAEVLGATRKVLHDLAWWRALLFDENSTFRLIDLDPIADPDLSKDWSETGAAGTVIEQSIPLACIGRVVDYLNTNIWHGDPSNLSRTRLALDALHAVVKSQQAFLTEFEDDAIDQDAIDTVKTVLNIFQARELLEEGRPLEIGHLAQITGFADKTIRMAAVGRDRNPDLVTYKDGKRTLIDPEEAIRWMQKKNFEYSPIEYSDAGTLPPVDPQTLTELGHCLREYREATNLSISELVAMVGWTPDLESSYEELEAGSDNIDPSMFDVDSIITLAQTLCPAESAEMAKIIDRVIHPFLLEARINNRLSANVLSY